MKSGRPKKGKTPPASPGENDSMAASERAASERAASERPAEQSQAGQSQEGGPTGRSRSDRTKPNRRAQDKQIKPPVRIVSNRSPEAEAIPENVSPEHIAQRAYELYAAGGYEPGREVEHWLEAERQLKAERRNRKRA
jgi:hypothetical protein